MNIELANKFTQVLWRSISQNVNEQCNGCHSYSTEYVHTCQILYNDYKLIYENWLRIFFDSHYNHVFLEMDWSELNHLSGGNKFWSTRYKKQLLKEKIFSCLLDHITEYTTNNCFIATV